LIFGVESKGLQEFIAQLDTEIKETVPAKMLHHGIYNNFNENRDKVFRQPDVSKLSESSHAVNIDEGLPAIAVTDGSNFLANPLLHQEVFGPYSLVIACKDLAEMQQVIDKMEGQLTATLMATDEDISGNRSIIDSLQHICGRLIYNGVPTGVEVCLSMQHGGPFPSSTDSRFTSVGADAIKRFVRPISFQNCPDQFLPDALKDSNPWGVVRTEN
jgi:NADP-dependent aldehyde dehydrogenase